MLLLGVSSKSIVHDAPCGRASNLAQRVAVPALWLPSLSSVPRGPARTGCSLQHGNTGACFVPLGTATVSSSPTVRRRAGICNEAHAFAELPLAGWREATASTRVGTPAGWARTFLTACRQFSRLSICKERCLSWASSCTTHAHDYPGTAGVREHPDQQGSDVPAPRHPARWRTP